MPDLKATIFSEVLRHVEKDLVEGTDYVVNYPAAKIWFSNGSEIMSRSWADKRYKKVRSLSLSGAVFEELTENNDDDKAIYDEVLTRVGRLPHIKENFIISATNPDSPQHWAYKRFFEDKSPTRHVYLSNTLDNPFLTDAYKQQLKRELDPKLARRMLYGEWIELNKEVIYYAYEREHNFRDIDYQPDMHMPIRVCFDFNIGEGKPLSAALMQFNGAFHIYGESVIHGSRTLDTCEEMFDRGLLPKDARFILHGDATGKHRDTRSKTSDWDIIRKFFVDNGLHAQFEVPLQNPPIRKRHNTVNAYCLNTAGERRLFCYRGAPTFDKGMRLSALKKGADYIEDDSKEYQHITTAVGYGVVSVHNGMGKEMVTSRRR